MKYSCIILLLLLSGCVSTTAPPQTYVPTNADVPEMVIGAKAVGGLFTDYISIMVNDEKVLSGRIYYWKQEDLLAGTFMGEEIKAYCVAENRDESSMTNYYCGVYFEGKWIVDLTF